MLKIITLILLTLLLMLPDLALKLVSTSISKLLSIDYIMGFIGLALLLSLCKNRKLRIAFCVFFGVLQLTQTLCISYFGIELSPETLQKFWHDPVEDFREIITALKVATLQFYMLGALVITCYVLIAILLFRGQTIKVPFASSLLLLIMIAAFVRVGMHSKPYLFAPNSLKPSLYNAFNTLALATFTKPMEQSIYLPYQVKYGTPKADNIIVIFGESIRDDYMSIFGFSKDTTPYMKAAISEGKAVAVRAFSSSVSTNISLPLFFNSVREPGNIHAVLDRTTSLFKMAKNQGYRTIMISAQFSSLLSRVVGNEVDQLITRESMNDVLFDQKRDSLMIDLLDEVELGPKNFIVLHMRSQHYPYYENYAHQKQLAIYSEQEIAKADSRELQQQMEYANAMKFSDLFVHEVVNYIESKFPKQTSYLFFTSDHGQMLGEEGLFMHHHLHYICAQVPFVVFAYNDKSKFLDKVQKFKKISHYDIALLIAERMGAEIYNPNDVDGKRYIQSSLHSIAPNTYLQIDSTKNY